MKWEYLLASVIIVTSGCAVPFQYAETINRGQAELIVGYSPFANFSFRSNFGITGITDLGFGFDFSYPPNANSFLFGRQKIFSYGRYPNFSLVATGSYGKIYGFEGEQPPPYYQYNLLAGFKSSSLLTIGGGILQDPRYSFDPFGGGFREEIFYNILFGVANKKGVIFQMQGIVDMKSKRIIANFGIGLRKGGKDK